MEVPVLTTTAVYRSGVLQPQAPLGLPENAEVTIQIVHSPLHDADDALMDDEQALRAMYSEVAVEDRQLAEAGVLHYAESLRREEDTR